MAPASWGIRPETCLGPATGGRLADGPFGRRRGRAHAPGGGRRRRADQPLQRRGHRLRLRDRPDRGRGPPPGSHQRRRRACCALTRNACEAEYGLYYRVARAFVRAIGRPQVMRACTVTGMHSRPLMEWLLRIMSNMLRPDEMGPAEAAYKALAAMAKGQDRPRSSVKLGPARLRRGSSGEAARPTAVTSGKGVHGALQLGRRRGPGSGTTPRTAPARWPRPRPSSPA